MHQLSSTSKEKIFIFVLVLSLLLLLFFSQPFSINWFSYDEARYYIMGVSWLLWMWIMTRQVILWIRPMFAWFTKDFFRINGLHKRLWIGTLMSLIFHPIASVISYGTSWLYVFSLDFSDAIEGWISIWKISFDLILIVLITSILSRKLLSYRSRHRVHLLSYPAFIWVWFHGRYTGTMIAELPLVRWYWLLIWWVLLVAMAVRIAYQYGYLKIPTTVLAHTSKTKEIYELELSLPDAIDYTEWQFMYMQIRPGGESHPFTILSYDKNTSVVKIAYKVYGKFTTELATINAWDQITLDGPYWVFMQEIETIQSPIVCIAAWIWITPFYDIIHNYSMTKDIKLLYLNKTKKDIVYETELESHLDQDCVHILSRESHANKSNQITNTRITPDIIKKTLWVSLWSAHFYLCGGGAVIKEVTKMLLWLWVPPDKIDFEPFTM